MVLMMVLMMIMMIIMIIIIIMIMTIVSVEQRGPGLGRTCYNMIFHAKSFFSPQNGPCSNNGAEIPQRSTLEPQWQTHKLGA